MNLATVFIALVLVAFLVLAVRYLMKHGMCAACEDRGACRAAQKTNGSGQSGGAAVSSGCSGKCSSCQYYELEKAAAAKHQAGI